MLTIGRIDLPLMVRNTTVHIVRGSQEQYAIDGYTYRQIVGFFEVRDMTRDPNPSTSMC